MIRKLYVNNLARRSGVLSLPPSLVRTPCSMTMIMVTMVLMIKTIMVIKTMMIRNNDHLTFPLRHKLKGPTDPLPSAWQRLLAHLLTSHQKRKVALKGFFKFLKVLRFVFIICSGISPGLFEMGYINPRNAG